MSKGSARRPGKPGEFEKQYDQIDWSNMNTAEKIQAAFDMGSDESDLAAYAAKPAAPVLEGDEWPRCPACGAYEGDCLHTGIE